MHGVSWGLQPEIPYATQRTLSLLAPPARTRLDRVLSEPVRPMNRRQKSLPEVNFSEYGNIRYLHLGTPWVQGSMMIDKPYDIHLDYVQRMMAWLLFVPLERVASMHAMQLGLGAAALTKFSWRHLRMTTTAIELNPQVVAACRLWFKLPPDSSRLSVVLGDAAEVAAHDHWRGQIDALQVDLYDHEAAAPVLDSAEFYADCRQLLSEHGIMTVNLFGRANRQPESLDKILTAFDPAGVWVFKPTPEGNTVVLAQRTPTVPNRSALMAQAEAIETRWPLPARRWVRVLKAVA